MIGSIEVQCMDKIASWMKSVKPTNLPTVLEGVFFMDGNPLPDDCITMYNSEWDENTLTLTLQTAAPLQWTYHKSFLGWLLLRSAQLTRFTYKIRFEDQSFQRAKITPCGLGVSIPRWVANLTMMQECENNGNGDVWRRENIWFGFIPKIGNYTLRRVVDAQGQATPAFERMLKKVQEKCLVVARVDETETVSDESEVLI